MVPSLSETPCTDCAACCLDDWTIEHSVHHVVKKTSCCLEDIAADIMMSQVIQPCLDMRNFDSCGDLLAGCHPDSRCRVAFETVSRRFSEKQCYDVAGNHHLAPRSKQERILPLNVCKRFHKALLILPVFHLVPRLELSNTVWGFTTLQHGDPRPFARMVMHQLQGLGL